MSDSATINFFLKFEIHALTAEGERVRGPNAKSNATHCVGDNISPEQWVRSRREGYSLCRPERPLGNLLSRALQCCVEMQTLRRPSSGPTPPLQDGEVSASLNTEGRATRDYPIAGYGDCTVSVRRRLN